MGQVLGDAVLLFDMSTSIVRPIFESGCTIREGASQFPASVSGLVSLCVFGILRSVAARRADFMMSLISIRIVRFEMSTDVH